MSADRILVTGATGFVGQRIMDRLVREGRVVVGVGGPKGPDGVDLADAAECRRLIDRVRPTKIVHLAAQSSVGATIGSPDKVWRSNFDLTRNLAVALAASSVRPHLIFASSAEVYGAAFNLGRCSEVDPIMPTSPYGRTKAAAEMLLGDISGPDLAVSSLRLFNHTGAGQDERFVLPSFAAQIAAAESLGGGVVEVGNLEARRDFTDVEDIIDAYAAVLDGPTPDDKMEVFNVGSGREIRIGDLLDNLIKHALRPIVIAHDPSRMRPSDIPVAAGNFSRFQSRYGWLAKRPIEGVLQEILSYERSKLNARVE
ncbi:MAG: NAD-dependent epimerase/dehydratase family protein [Brevundimonas sp.]|uniref:NAD-dependent epimerase/dehydratase family protein n=1 Tax=Brevundimonas sp. TaxID=1871086 RepID=UPI003567ACD4